MSTDYLNKLHEMRRTAGPVRTRGLDDRSIEQFLACDARLGPAIIAAMA